MFTFYNARKEKIKKHPQEEKNSSNCFILNNSKSNNRVFCIFGYLY